MDEKSLASELLHELKTTCKRWFIAFIIMVGVEVATIVGFLWYISLPVEVEDTRYEQQAENQQNSKSLQIIGGGYNDEADGEEDIYP